MPKLQVIKSRKSRVSGQPSQVAGALIPDNTQHSWRDDVGKVPRIWLSEEFDHGVGRRDGQNFGYGRQLSYAVAGPQALRDMFGGGHQGTIKGNATKVSIFGRDFQQLSRLPSGKVYG